MPNRNINMTLNNTLERESCTYIQECIYEEKPVYDAVKRIFDIIVSIVCLIITSPIMLIVALAIKLQDGGSVIYTRVCIGKNGKPYKMYKFRSMIMDADYVFDLFTPEQIARYEAGDKSGDDPRITKVGRFLRRTSIDELPQLISVLANSMSIVGPRPVIEREADAYGKDKDKLLSVKPGITGYWQIKGRSDSAFLSDKAKAMQLYYVDNRSCWLDLKILFATVLVVLRMEGAR